jgi:hypothetical protein
MHTQSLSSELGKTGISVNLGIYYRHQKYLVGGLTLDMRLQTFILLKLFDIYISQVNQMFLEIGKSREPKDHKSCCTGTHDLLPSPQYVEV